MEETRKIVPVRRPAIASLEAAIRIYFSKDYIGNKEIVEIFGDKIGANTICKLKEAVREEEDRRSIPIVVPCHVDTEVAYEVWSIDVEKLVNKRSRLKRLGML